MVIILNNWYGRLGNNIIQISNIIDFALFYEHNIQFKVKHKFFNLKTIEYYFDKYKNNKIIKDKFNFYYYNRIIPLDVIKKNYKIKINLMKKSFIIKDEEIDKLNENDIVIHIRSGDIFNKNPNPLYIPPPLAYYVNILNKNIYKKIIIVCEDDINPVVNKLLELYENAVYKKKTLNEDIKLILGGTNIISSVGTFVNSLLMFSNNVKNHYVIKIYNDKLKEYNFSHYVKNDYETINYSDEVKEYYLIAKPWKNTKEQQKYILSYKM